MQAFDVVVNGGGMVGAATGLGLAQLGLSVAIIERQTPKPFDPVQPMDLRVSAISVASEQLLERLGVWQDVLDTRACPYKGLQTWEEQGFSTEFHSDQINTSHLGHIIENRLIQLALWKALKAHDKVTIFGEHQISQFTLNGDRINLSLNSGDSVSGQLLVGADGAMSQVRQWAGIGISGWEYKQHAMLINITTAAPQQDTTWQQFFPSGPRAFLPLTGNHGSLVWYDAAERIAELSQMTNEELAVEIRKAFPERLGEFSVDGFGEFPLVRRHAQRYVDQNLVLIGDAAHTINPLAGQGVNLGFKDVAALLETVVDAISQGKDWSAVAQLQQYQSKRYKDNLLMMSAMDMFYATFSNKITPIKVLRNVGLKLANHSGPVKKQVLKYAMGLN
ncbi:FAD-dependent monooxygenase [Paraferrimonas sedimenticola]|uniref:2-octaprenyl-3-methyl-6-methoxy-1,4-benzoquinol hydroxylase n=1 Tax=Paraferrimonas sedimenticola TaxID=375674 RepID=A0AA37RZ25_9GAMM|nr:FAD-dependent monooxygenase [Paraferrimonas sedimenticola]GLP98001.1 2-octaprenyl-3-methyl-6-methoxy-1,4-benzoquinol hydroxylase [Paraferrimonas sedimenticola]